MQQTVNVQKKFNNMSSKIEISAVYQKENTLIAVTNILPSRNMCDALCTRTASITVETNADRELPVQVKFLEKGQFSFNIPEIRGLQPLPVVPEPASGNITEYSDSSEENLFSLS